MSDASASATADASASATYSSEPDALDAIAHAASAGLWRAFGWAAWAAASLPAFGDDDEPLETPESAALVKRLPLRDAFCAASGRELRLLCLHGRGSNNDITALQFNNMRLRTRLSLDFLHGPELASAQSSTFELFSAKPFQAWWSGTLSAAKLRRLVAYLEHYVARLGPFDGLFGFSQGAALATLASAADVRHALGLPEAPPWKFVVCGNGVHLGDEAVAELCGGGGLREGAVRLRSLHLVGRFDYCRASSQSLAMRYDSGGARVHYHDSGHELPAALGADAPLQEAVAAFFQQAGGEIRE